MCGWLDLQQYHWDSGSKMEGREVVAVGQQWVGNYTVNFASKQTSQLVGQGLPPIAIKAHFSTMMG